ncbi:glycoside hydrolase family 97 protein [Bacteroides nordii]|uniref:glycoside hydrolase family 97 protein n=1 Tax=Bacteroides nordii TaxID=291645 RepID=UPI0021094521|nr:glycoside hydrolase family 97 protein [Bacteroides nordii]MCQ4914871.1 glycoside hydrolase family 97 protein [Bacteroides nordii]
MKKHLILTIALYLTATLPIKAQEEYTVSSPNGSLELKISMRDTLSYQIFADGEALSEISPIAMIVERNGRRITLGENPAVEKCSRNSISQKIPMHLGENDQIDNTYNEMILDLGTLYSLHCRAYDEGVAYRIESKISGSITIRNEIAEFNFKDNPQVWIAYDEDKRTMSQWELPYKRELSVKSVKTGDYGINPCFFRNNKKNIGITVIESDLENYPGMYLLKKEAGNKLVGKWAEYPKKIKNDSKYDSQAVLERYDYIALTPGVRTYPWRGFIISRDDSELMNNDLIYKLAKPQVERDFSWISAGRTAFEWLHDGELEGDLGFIYGPFGDGRPHTLEFYKYYVDFAAEMGFEWMTCDAGWGEEYIKELCTYAKSKNIKIMVWSYFNFLLVDEPMLARFKEWGISGVKADFMSRDDQVASGWIPTMAERCAKYQLMLLLHGCPKPVAWHRTYPNIISYEAVTGEESNKWNDNCNPLYHTVIPFLRMLGGAMDMTPGSLRNKTRKGWTWKGTGAPWSLGTRAHQMAQYVVYHQTLGFVSDAPTEYRKFPEIMEFLKHVPTIWNETKPLQGKIGEFAVMARRSDKEWYVGGLSNWTERTLDVDFSFLTPGIPYKAYIIEDVPEKNNDTSSTTGDATACKCHTIDVTSQTRMSFKLAEGGGFVMRIYPDPNYTSVKNTALREKVQIWYEQNNESIYVQLPEHELTADIHLYDITGRPFYPDYTKKDNPLCISIAQLSRGYYCVKCTTPDLSQSKLIYKN